MGGMLIDSEGVRLLGEDVLVRIVLLRAIEMKMEKQSANDADQLEQKRRRDEREGNSSTHNVA